MEVVLERKWDEGIRLSNVDYSVEWRKVVIPDLEQLNKDEKCLASRHPSLDGNKATVFYAVRWFPSLSRSFIELTWTVGDTKSVKSRQMHVPAPQRYDQNKLEEFSRIYGKKVYDFCENARLRKSRIGNGSCYDLATGALNDAAKPGPVSPVMTSIRYIHGQCILFCDRKITSPNLGNDFNAIVMAIKTDAGSFNEAEVERSHDESGNVGSIKRGDIVQYENTIFLERKNSPNLTGITIHPNPDDIPPGKSHTSYLSVSMALMFSIIKEALGNGKFTVIEQNGGVIAESELNIGFLSQGKLWVYRPVPAEWAWGKDKPQTELYSWSQI